MKILFLSDSPISIQGTKDGYNGRGWIEAELSLLQNEHNIKIGVAYNSKISRLKSISDNITFYPIQPSYVFNWKPLNSIFRWLNLYDSSKDIFKLKKAISDFAPDIIYIYGSEWFGLDIIRFVSIPVIIHIQGICIPYNTCFFPPNYSLLHLIMNNFATPIPFFKANSLLFQKRRFSTMAKREQINFPYVKYYTGRTEWDYSVTRLLSPKSTYFHLNEVLRLPFYGAEKWHYSNEYAINIVSTISNASYKGLDLIYRCVSILSEISPVKIHWTICGISKKSEIVFLFESLYKKSNNVTIKLAGVVSAEEIISMLQKSTMYVHPSYIDNSPNSLCEAQYLGIPVIATNVGGVSSLIINKMTGILIPSNDFCMLSYQILNLYNNVEFANQLSKNEIACAEIRHNPITIKKELITICQQICEHESVNNNNK